MNLFRPQIRLMLGATMISFSPVLVSIVSVAPTVSGFYRVFFGALVLLVYLLVTRQSVTFSRSAWTFIGLAAISFTIDLWFWHRSILLVGPGLSTLLGNCQVFFLTAAGVVLYRQMPSLQQLIALPLAIVGLALLVGIDWNSLPADYRLGVIFGLLTAVSYAAYLLCLRGMQREDDRILPAPEMAVISLLAAAMLGLTAFAEGESLAIESAGDGFWLFCYGMIPHAFGWLMIASSLREVRAAVVGLLLLLQPVLSFVWDVLLFGRGISLLEFTGAVITLTAIYFGSRGPRAKA